MLEMSQAQENNFSKIPPTEMQLAEKDGGDLVIFTKEEWKYFLAEVDKQIAEKEVIDYGKATRNARYLAKLDEAFDDEGGTKMTFDELELLINEGRKI